MKKYYKVSLIYGYSAKNAGDFAITLGAIDTLHKAGITVKLFSRYSKDDIEFIQSYKTLNARYHDAVEIYDCPFTLNREDGFWATLRTYFNGILTILNIKRQAVFRKELLDCDLVVFNGGNLFRCNSFIDFTRLLALVYPLNISRKTRKPYIIFPQSASSLNFLGRALLKPVLNNAELVMTREKESYEYLSSIFKSVNYFQTIDLAFFINQYCGTRLLKKNYFGYVAITLRFHTVGDISYLSDCQKKYIFTILGGIVEKIKRIRNVLIVVQTEKDEAESRSFAQLHNVELLKCQDVPSLIYLYQQVDLLIGMRLHSIILALSAGTPCIGLFYKEWGLKNSGLMNYFGLPYYSLDRPDIKVNEIYNAAADIICNRSVYSRHILNIIKREYSKICDELENRYNRV